MDDSGTSGVESLDVIVLTVVAVDGVVAWLRLSTLTIWRGGVWVTVELVVAGE